MICPPLSYSSCFWFNHLQEAPFDGVLLDAINRLFRRKFLYWLEVLSLLEQVPITPMALGVAAKYVKVGLICILSFYPALKQNHVGLGRGIREFYCGYRQICGGL
jgi:hypothetical protein